MMKDAASWEIAHRKTAIDELRGMIRRAEAKVEDMREMLHALEAVDLTEGADTILWEMLQEMQRRQNIW